MAKPDEEVFIFTCCTGSAGNVGGNSARALHSRAMKEGRKFKIRLAARNTEKARNAFTDLGDSVEVVHMDLGKPETFNAALEGASAVFLGHPDFGGLDSQELLESFIHAVENTKPAPPFVLKFVAGALSPVFQSLCNEFGCDLLDSHFLATQAIQEARSKGRIQALIMDVSSWFFQNYSTLMAPLVKAGELAIPNGDVSLPHIDSRDIGEFAAAMMLGKSKHSGKDVILTGGYRLSRTDWADLVSRATGRKITSSDDERPLREALRALPLGPNKTLWDMYERFFEVEHVYGQRDDVVLHPEVYENATGKKHRGPEDFCTEMAATSCWRAD